MTINKAKIQQQLKDLVDKSNQYLNVQQNKQRVVAYIYIILSFFSLSFFGLFAIGPTLSTISELNKEYADEQNVLKQLQDKNSNLRSLNAQYLQIQPDLSLITNAIPDSPNVSQLTRQVEVLATKNSLVLQKLDTGLLELYPAKNANTSIFSFMFSATVRGSEKDINNFIAEIINIDRIIGIERLSTGKQQNDFTAAITGKAFFFNQ
jgi:Tfp pilus assembly protein PilO